MRWKEMGKKRDNKKQYFDRQDEEKLAESDMHTAGFSFTDIESNLVTLWFEMLEAEKKLGMPMRSSGKRLTLYIMQYYVQNKEPPLLLLLLNLEL